MSDDPMAWAVFFVESNWHRPGSRFSFNAKPSPAPQQRPRDFIDYCVSKGWAEGAPALPKRNAPAGSGVVKRAQKSRSRA
jgi:hypothetical protein